MFRTSTDWILERKKKHLELPPHKKVVKLQTKMTSISSSSLDFQAKMHLILMFSTKAKPLKKKVYFRTISLKIKEKSILLHKLKLVFDLFVLMNLRIRKLILSGLTFKFMSMSLSIRSYVISTKNSRFHFCHHDFHLCFDFWLLRRSERPLSKGGSCR